jgi:hypothetical protein
MNGAGRKLDGVGCTFAAGAKATSARLSRAGAGPPPDPAGLAGACLTSPIRITLPVSIRDTKRGFYRLFRKARAVSASATHARGFSDYLRISHSLGAGFIRLKNAQPAMAFPKRGERDPFQFSGRCSRRGGNS